MSSGLLEKMKNQLQTGKGPTRKDAERDAAKTILDIIKICKYKLSPKGKTLLLVDGDHSGHLFEDLLNIVEYIDLHIFVQKNYESPIKNIEKYIHPSHLTVKNATDADLIFYLGEITGNKTILNFNKIIIISKDSVFTESVEIIKSKLNYKQLLIDYCNSFNHSIKFETEKHAFHGSIMTTIIIENHVIKAYYTSYEKNIIENENKASETFLNILKDKNLLKVDKIYQGPSQYILSSSYKNNEKNLPEICISNSFEEICEIIEKKLS